MAENKFIGPYQRKNVGASERKSKNFHDPKHKFYEAMLFCNSYDAYYKQVGGLKVQPKTFKGLVTAHMEMRYARSDRGWIEDRR